jgi:hypothetical protein
MLHFDEKRGKSREIPVAHDLKVLFDEYLEATGIQHERRKKDPGTGEFEPIYLFRTALGRTGRLTTNPMDGNDIYRMMRRHAAGGHRVRFRRTVSGWPSPRTLRAGGAGRRDSDAAGHRTSDHQPLQEEQARRT